jgi:hypothetical protein
VVKPESIAISYRATIPQCMPQRRARIGRILAPPNALKHSAGEDLSMGTRVTLPLVSGLYHTFLDAERFILFHYELFRNKFFAMETV